MLPDPDDPQTWLAKAALDSRAVSPLLNAAPPLTDAACFHIQQAIEKSLKAVVVAKRLPMPLTHSIGELLDLLGPDATLDRLYETLAATTRYAVELRYPGTDSPPLAEVRRAMDAMEQLFEWVQQQIDSLPSA